MLDIQFFNLQNLKNDNLDKILQQIDDFGIDEVDSMTDRLKKLKNQSETLKKSIAHERSLESKICAPIHRVVERFIKYHISPILNIQSADYFVQDVRTKKPQSDLVCPCALRLFKQLSLEQKKKFSATNPFELAQFISHHIPNNEIFDVVIWTKRFLKIFNFIYVKKILLPAIMFRYL